MDLQVISTPNAPLPVGPYSQGIVASGKLLFVSGQIPLDPATGELAVGGIVEQTDRSMQNLKAVVEAGGSSLAQIIKTTVFLTDMADFTAMNQVYAQYFGDHAPARACVQVSALPRGAVVEVECIAVVG